MDHRPTARGLILFLLPITSLSIGGHADIDLGAVLAAVTLPASLRALRFSRTLTAITAIMAVAAISAPILVLLSVSNASGRSVDASTEVRLIALLLRCILILIVVLWARTNHKVSTIGLLYGGGSLIEVLINHGLWSGNAWKYAFAWPVTVFLLALIYHRGRIAATIVLLGCAAFSEFYNSRSFLILCLLPLAIFLYRYNKPNRGAQNRSWRGVLVATFILILAYFIGQSLILNGAFGNKIQALSEQQTTESGQTLLFAARPEGYAALSLFENRPIGYGPGVRPDVADVDIAERALRLAGTSTNSLYVQSYLFGPNGLELQTVLGDLWANFGIVGIILAITIGRELLFSTGRFLQSHRSPALLIFLSISSLWWLIFGTISTNFPAIIFSVALVVRFSATRESVGLNRRSAPIS